MLNEKIIAAAIAYFEENENDFNECIEELDSYNGYLGDNRYYDMDELNEIYHDTDPIELLNRAYFGYDAESYVTDANGNKQYMSFNPNRDYFTFNGYGNLVSANYKDYSSYLDKWFIESLYENADEIYSLPDEIKDLFESVED